MSSLGHPLVLVTTSATSCVKQAHNYEVIQSISILTIELGAYLTVHNLGFCCMLSHKPADGCVVKKVLSGLGVMGLGSGDLIGLIAW